MTIDQLPTLSDPTGDVYFPVNKNGADYKLPTGGVTHLRGANAANAIISFYVSNAARFVLITSSGNSTGRGMWIFNSASNGTISNSAVLSASGVTIDASANYLELTLSSAGAWMILVFGGTVTLS